MAELSDAEVFGGAPDAQSVAPVPPGGIYYDGGHGISVQVGGDPGPMPGTQSAPPAAAQPHELSDADVFSGGSLDPSKPTSETLGLMEGIAKPLRRFNDINDATLGAIPLVGSLFHSSPDLQNAGQQMDAYFAHREQTQRPGLLGKVGGETIGTAPVSVLGPLAGGAVAGGLLSDAKTPQGVAVDMGVSALGGKFGDMALNGLRNVVSPVVSDAARKLLGEGVGLTPGQILGGGMHRLEDGMTSIPILGDIIKNAQGRSISDFNRAAINRSLTPIGAALPKDLPAGYDAVDFAHRTLGDAYDSLLPGLRVRMDPKFQTDVTNLRSLAQNLTPEYTKKFETILQNEVMGRFAPQTGVMTGQTMKEVETALGQQASRFGKIQDGHAQDYADAVRELQAQLRGLVERSNPKAADALKAVNAGWANLVRVENAASRQGATGGVFTPSQLLGATRAGDNSVRKSATARGSALMQDLASAGKDVLPSTVPDSGSPFRHALEATVALLVGQEAHALPLMAKGAVAGGLLGGAYTRTGQRMITPLLTERPAGAAEVARQLQKLRPLFISGGASVASQPQLGSAMTAP